MRKAGLYIHIPFCVQKCSYCDFFSVKCKEFSDILEGKKGSIFAKRLIEDIEFQKEKYQIDEWNTVYIGGGTPSILSEWDIDFICSSILCRQKNLPAEFTIEVNPDDITGTWLETAVNAGVNRISVGVQSFSDEVLKAEKRRGSRIKTISAIEKIKTFKNVLLSCDLIAGLKNQTEEILKNDLRTLLNFLPQHISFYSLCTEKRREEDTENYIDLLWLKGKDILENNGYNLYEVSNFSYKNLYKSIHNNKYWKLHDYGGVGPGAFGSIFYGKKQIGTAGALRFCSCKNIKKWLSPENLNSVYEYEDVCEKEFIEETLMMNLRLTEGINKKEFYDRFNIEINDVIKKTILKWSNAGKAFIDDDFFRLTSEGFIFLNFFLKEAFEELDLSLHN